MNKKDNNIIKYKNAKDIIKNDSKSKIVNVKDEWSKKQTFVNEITIYISFKKNKDTEEKYILKNCVWNRWFWKHRRTKEYHLNQEE